MLSPRQAFEDNIRPAELLLGVYRLLECDFIHMDGGLVRSLRTTIHAEADEELMKIIEETARRRNDIGYRSDRSSDDPEGEAQDISYSFSKQAVDTVMHVSLALDELVVDRIAQLQAQIAVL